MNIDTQLREAADAVREARRESDLAVVPPTRRSVARGPLLAGVAAVAALVVIGIPALIPIGGNQPLTQPADVGADAPASTEPDPAEPVSDVGAIPRLMLNSSAWQLTGATEVVSPETGATIARELVYENESGAIWITVHKSSFDKLPAWETLDEARSSESIQLDGRDVTLHVIDHEQLDGPALETHALQWSEDEFGIIVIGWGLDRDSTLGLYDSVNEVDEAAWDAGVASTGGATPTTIAPQEPEGDS